MKKIVSLLLVAVIALSSMLMFNSCASSKIEEGFSKVKATIESVAYDPDAVIFNYAEGVLDVSEERIYYKVNYNGKNRFGGYVGNRDDYYRLDLKTNEVSVTTKTLFDITRALSETDDVNYCYEKITFK